jgi:hypothetical protein
MNEYVAGMMFFGIPHNIYGTWTLRLSFGGKAEAVTRPLGLFIVTMAPIQ